MQPHIFPRHALPVGGGKEVTSDTLLRSHRGMGTRRGIDPPGGLQHAMQTWPRWTAHSGVRCSKADALISLTHTLATELPG